MSLKDPANHDGYHSPATFPFTYLPKVSFFQKLFSDSRFMIHFIGKVRRQYLVNFRKKYVQKQITRREGACRQCGTCCSLLITCPMLQKKGHCLAYGICRPQSCKAFPIDRRDLREVRLYNGNCGFHFGPGTRKEGEKENR